MTRKRISASSSVRSGQPSGATSTFGRGARPAGFGATASLGRAGSTGASFAAGIVCVVEVVLPANGLLASGTSPVRFTAGISVLGRFGGGVPGLGTAALGLGTGALALGVAVALALAPTMGVGAVAPVLGGAGARVIGFVGARPVAGFAPGS
jgi:hypothetical protein